MVQEFINMIKKLPWFIGLGLLSLIFASSAGAQPGPGGGGGYGFRGRMYNPQTEETFKAEVLKVETFTSRRGRQTGVHLVVKTDQETIPVQLGPSFFLEQQGITFAPQDKVEVTGSRVNLPRGPVIIAREVKKGGQILKLRNADGIPLWSGTGFRGPGQGK
jgi:hypothetical protein